MSTRTSDRSRLGAAVAVSVAVHLGVGAVLGLGVGGADVFADLAQRGDVRLPPITLGREQSEHETLTWIGHTDPTQHQAQLAPVEQAAMSPTPPPTTSSSPPAPRTSQPTPVLAEPTPEQVRAVMVEQAQVAYVAVERWSRRFDASVDRALEMLRKLVDREDSSRESDNTGDPVPRETIARRDDAEPQQTPTKSSGNAQEQESEGTSTSEPTKIQMGKPAAARGLFIRTVRPTYGLVTRATARPADPVVKVEFLSDGSVDQVHIERSSENDLVDRAIVDAVFMWTAEGERLEKLRNRDTISIRFRISL